MLGGSVREEVKRPILCVSDQLSSWDIRFRINNHLADINTVREGGRWIILTSRIDEIVEDGILAFPRSPSDRISSIVSVILFADAPFPSPWFCALYLLYSADVTWKIRFKLSGEA